MKLFSLCIILILPYLGFTQLSDHTLANNGCSFPGSDLDARGPINLIPNGHFNTGSTCRTESTYHYATRFGTHWSTTYFNSSMFPKGIPSVKDPTLSWRYTMFWRNESMISGATISRGYMYINAYQKNNAGVPRRNYILIELNKPLVDGREYIFEAKYNSYNSTFTNIAPDNVNLQMDRIGFALTNTIPTYTSGQPILLTPFYETPKDSIISFAHQGVNMTVTGAGQRYLIIGNFHENDSIAFNAIPANNSHATYAFDALKLYDPNCNATGNVYFNTYEQTACAGNPVSITAQHGVMPYKWLLNGVELPDTTRTVNFVMPKDTSFLVVQIGEGNCTSSDTLKLLPRYYNINNLPSDTMLYCGWNVNLSPQFTDVGGAQAIGNFRWYKQSNPNLQLGSSANYSASDSGIYILKFNHSNSCVQYDTIHITNNLEILKDSLSLQTGAEHCINMNNAFIEYDISNYPTNLHFYWTPDLISTDNPKFDSLNAGIYEYYLFDDLNRCSFFTDTLQLYYDSCSIIRGTIYEDADMNCIKNNSEQGIEGVTVYTNPLQNFSVTDSLGNFEIFVPPGTYELQQNLSNNIALGEFCNNITLNVSQIGLILDSNFIGDTIRHFFHNPAIKSLVFGPVLLNNPYSLSTFKVANMGDSINNITVGIHIDHPVLNYDIHLPEYIGMNGDTAMYLFSNMEAFSSITRNMYLPINEDISYLGDQVNISIFCRGEHLDIDSTNNNLLQSNIVLAAYDPNIKIVTPLGEQLTHKTEVNERKFVYTVHFQNTGNAPARNVLIRDTLTTLLDISTFQLMDASHSVTVSAYNRIIHFMFENINLPDSTSDEVNSKGYVQFNINTVNDAYVGDTVKNSANIYFDNNPPIITPEAINIYYKPIVLIDTLANVCEGNSVFFNGNLYTETGIYNDTTTGYSIDTVYQAIVNIISPQITNLTVNLCENDSVYFFGSYINHPGITSHTLSNYLGCDSTIILTVLDHTFNTDVNVLNNGLIALEGMDSYQWFDCSTQQEILGATDKYYIPEYNGSFSVILNDGICQDTSSCYTFSNLKIEKEKTDYLKIVPNPTTGVLYVTNFLDEKFEVVDVFGKTIDANINQSNDLIIIDISHCANGIYFIKSSSQINRIIKQSE